MITLYVLLLMAVAVLGNPDLEEVCPYEACWPDTAPKFSNKPALRLKILIWRRSSDLEVIKVTPNLEYLSVHNCSSDFKMDIFPPMAALRKMNISTCPILELQENQFENLNNLETLALAGNSIEILSNETFHKLSLVRFLHLQNNLIRVLPEGVFNPLESLYQLNLNNNNISILPKDTFLRNTNLIGLNLRGNPLKTVSLDFPIWTYSALVALDLSDCKELRDLQLSIRVGDLYLKNSGVERLQFTGSIRQIHHENSKVTRADFSKTYFYRSFVEVLCDMPSLEWLHLSNSSKLSDYSYFEPDQNGKECNFPNLRSLNLTANKLNYIPRRLPLFGPNLTSLDLSHNLLEDDSLELLFDLDTPKEEEGNFPNLRFLHMAGNKLTKIPRRCPFFGPNLSMLDLSHNLLENVSLDSFSSSPNLQSLYLEGNRMKSFDYLSVCDALKNLKRLSLYENRFNATFNRNMRRYLREHDLHLFGKGKRIFVETENQDKNEN